MLLALNRIRVKILHSVVSDADDFESKRAPWLVLELVRNMTPWKTTKRLQRFCRLRNFSKRNEDRFSGD